MGTYSSHYSVLKNECLEYLTSPFSLSQGKDLLFADLTFGAGGHSIALLETLPDASVIAVDQDPDAIENGKKLIDEKKLSSRIELWHSNFEDFPEKFHGSDLFEKYRGLNGIIIDLGVSSHHFDDGERGFSYRFEGPLDMRMNTKASIPTAADLVNALSAEELARLFFDYGEERLGRKIAEKIVEERRLKKIETTKELENIIFHVYPKKWRFGRTNPSTKVFQALRIYVNRELSVLEKVIDVLPSLLLPQSRLAIISFHSLEDRIVKHRFKKIASEECFDLLTKKPIIPSEKELEENSRSRSAKLRVLERNIGNLQKIKVK